MVEAVKRMLKVVVGEIFPEDAVILVRSRRRFRRVAWL